MPPTPSPVQGQQTAVEQQGPYVVTVKRPTVGYDVTWGQDPIVERGERVVSRRAFAELYGFPDSASAHVWEIVHAAHAKSTFKVHEWKAARTAIHRLPAEGGKVGPLPDGTLIEVEATTWEALGKAAGLDERDAQCVVRYSPLGVARQAQARILAAFNAAQPAPSSQAGEGR